MGMSGRSTRPGASATIPTFLAIAPIPAIATIATIAARKTPAARRSNALRAVRLYRGPKRIVMVGNINEVCRMIDRCIANENPAFGRLFD